MHSNLCKRLMPSSYFYSLLMLISMTIVTTASSGLPTDIDASKPTSVGGHLLSLSSNRINDMADNKRAWQSLQGSWGKRDSNGFDLNSPPTLNTDDYDNNLELGNGNNNNDNDNNNDYDYQDLVRYAMFYPRPELVIPAATASLNEEKRGWKNMNVAWGKRRSADWNKFRGAWGKREPGWNNLKGIWGKRGNDWNKLQSAWGKRSQQ